MEEGQASSPWNYLGNNIDDGIRNLRVPEGYRFDPTDHELVVDYLNKKINNQELPSNKIHQVDLYRFNPGTLAGMGIQMDMRDRCLGKSPLIPSPAEDFKFLRCTQEGVEHFEPFGDEEWYFFTPRTRSYRNGERPNRAAGNGYWKATGTDKPIRVNGIVVASKSTLVHYVGAPPNWIKSNWVMHEYVDKTYGKRQKQHDQDMRLDDCVLCRIYRKGYRRTPRPRLRPMNDDAPTGFPSVIPDNSQLPASLSTTTSGILSTPDTGNSNIISSGFSTPISHTETPLISNGLPLMISNYNPAGDLIPYHNLDQNNYSAQSFPSHYLDISQQPSLRGLFAQDTDMEDFDAQVFPDLATNWPARGGPKDQGH